jgi:hypothetical protein
MADFTTTGAVQQPSDPFKPQQPVVDRSAGVVVDTLGKAMQVFSDVQDLKGEAAKNKIVGGFANEILLIAEGANQGKVTTREARNKINSLMRQTASGNAELFTELSDIYAKVLNQTGLGTPIKEGTEEEQRFAKRVEAANADGFLFGGMSSEEISDAVDRHTAFTQADFIIRHNTSKTNLGIDETNLMRMTREEQSNRALATMHSSYIPSFSSQVQAVISGLNTTSDPQAKSEAIRQLDVLLSSAKSQSDSFGSFADRQYKDSLFSPYEEIIAQAKLMLDDKITTQAWKDFNDRSIAKSQGLLLSNPKLAVLAAGSRLFADNPTLWEVSNIDPEVTVYLKNLLDGKPMILPPIKLSIRVLKTYSQIQPKAGWMMQGRESLILL